MDRAFAPAPSASPTTVVGSPSATASDQKHLNVCFSARNHEVARRGELVVLGGAVSVNSVATRSSKRYSGGPETATQPILD